MNKANFFEAICICNAEGSDVISLFNLVDKYTDHIERVKVEGLSFSDINNDVSLEGLIERRQKSLMAFMYAFFRLNKAYKEATGFYLCGKIEKSEKNAEKLYRGLLKVI